jgi:hypothetical protein
MDLLDTMDLLKVMLAGFGLGLAIYAAMETEPEQMLAMRALHMDALGGEGIVESFAAA